MRAQKAVVFVPGFASTQEPGTVQPFLNILDTLGYDTFYVPSQRYLPLTNNQQHYPSVLWDQAINVINCMDKHRLRGAIGIGHSLGALILMIAATERPDLFLPPRFTLSSRHAAPNFPAKRRLFYA